MYSTVKFLFSIGENSKAIELERIYNFFTGLTVEDHKEILRSIFCRFGINYSNAHLCDSLLSIDYRLTKMQERIMELQLENYELRKLSVQEG